MTRRDATLPEDRDPDEIQRRYEAIREELRDLPTADLAHHLPNLVDTLAETSAESDATIHFIVGVSFTREHTPLDYQLDHLVTTDRGTERVESLKSAVSQDHFYLRFTYPPDPHFDASALRGAILATIEQRLRVLEETPRSDSQIAALWKHLAWRTE